MRHKALKGIILLAPPPKRIAEPRKPCNYEAGCAEDAVVKGKCRKHYCASRNKVTRKEHPFF